MTTVSQLGEFGLIDRITAGLPTSRSVVVGPGDDCAVVRLAGPVAVSTDTMVQGRHWNDRWSSPHDVGRRLVAAAAADLEAEGASGLFLVVATSLPPSTPLEWVDGLTAGIVEECGRAGLLLLGGDTTVAEQIVLTATVVGDLAGRAPVTRSGAVPGQVIALCGRLGWAAAGLAVLERGFRSPAAVVNAHRVPQPPYGQGVVAAMAGATAMIDVSDGLLADLGHIASSSGVTIDVDTTRFELAEPQRAVAAALGRADPLRFLLAGGDDHALVASFEEAAVPRDWTVIAQVRAGDPVVLVDGATWDGPTGWQHLT